MTSRCNLAKHIPALRGRLAAFFLLMAIGLHGFGQEAPASAKLYGTPIGSPNIDYNTNRSSETVNTPACAFDGDYSTYYASMERSRTWVGLDLGTAHVITKVGWSCRDGFPARVQLGIFEGSNSEDFLDAVPLYLIPDAGVNRTMLYADVPVTRGFRYVRYVGPNDVRCNIAELEFFGYESTGTDSLWYQVTNLPTVSIHTYAGYDPQDKVTEMPANITITYDHGTRIQEYPITARGRGNASWGFPKKPWRIKFADGNSHRMLKDSPQESPAKAKKWTLINNYGDKTLMRNCLAFEVSKRMNALYTPWCQPVDVIMNGEYKGCYQLCDQITADKNRVPITEMLPDDNEEPLVSGGYLIEVDNFAHQEKSWFNSNRNIPVTIKHPGDDDITPQQHNYIQNYFNLMESAVFASNYTDPNEGFRKYLDIESFLRHFLIAEFAGNTDTYWSTYMYKEREETQFHVAPVWDFDLAFDNDSRIYPVSNRSDWVYRTGGSAAGNMRSFVDRLLSDDAVNVQMRQIWQERRKEGLIDERSLMAYVDSMANEMDASQHLNFIRWPILNERVHLNVEARGSFDAEVDVLRNYIPTRLQWFDEYFGIDSGIAYVDSTYYISSPEQLVEFSQAVRGGAVYSEGFLEADIDMEGYNTDFLPIGNASRPFRGHFDGQGHRISNLHVTGGEFTGLFGAVGGGANICNLTLDASCTISGSNYVGLVGGSNGTGRVKLTCLGNEAQVTATGINAAGIIGCNKGTTATFTITDCYNAAGIVGSAESATISGWVGTNAVIENCYNIGTVTGYNYRNDLYRGGASINNCYSTFGAQVNRITSDDVESGKLCYRLNAGRMLEPVWFQTLGEDAYPIFDSSHGIVLKAEDDTYYNSSALAGDVDGSGTLDDDDIAMLIAYLTEEDVPEGFQEVNADANFDGSIDVADLVTMRRIISGTPAGDSPLTATLYSSNASVKAGGTRKVTVWTNMSRPATAYEADIVLSEGLSVNSESIAFGTKINSTYHVTHVLPKGNGVHVLVYAPGNEEFLAKTGTAFTFTLAGAEDFAGGTWQIRDQRFVTADGVVALPDDADYDVSLAKTYVAAISLSPSSIDMLAGSDTTLNVVVLPETATIKTLSWSSSDETVATVSDGIVTALANGMTTITAAATDGSDVKASVIVYVYDDATDIMAMHGDRDKADANAIYYNVAGQRVPANRKAAGRQPNGIRIARGKKVLLK